MSHDFSITPFCKHCGAERQYPPEVNSLRCPGLVSDVVMVMTGLERRLFNFLRANEGKVLTVPEVMDGLYANHDNEPHQKIIDVVICRLRKKLKGTPFAIETRHGEGRRLIREQRIAAAG